LRSGDVLPLRAASFQPKPYPSLAPLLVATANQASRVTVSEEELACLLAALCLRQSPIQPKAKRCGALACQKKIERTAFPSTTPKPAHHLPQLYPPRTLLLINFARERTNLRDQTGPLRHTAPSLKPPTLCLRERNSYRIRLTYADHSPSWPAKDHPFVAPFMLRESFFIF
jgi:hypothetical protein